MAAEDGGSIWSRRTNEKSAFLASTGARVVDESDRSHGVHDNHSHRHNGHSGHNNNNNNNGHHHGYHGPSHHSHGHHGHRRRHFDEGDTVDKINEDGLRIVTPRVGSNILQSSWTVWFLHRGPGMKIQNYLQATKQVATFHTVEEFWDVYTHLRRVDKLPFTSEFQVFRKGVKPMWEDPINSRGGKWVVRFRRPLKDRKTDQTNGPAAAVNGTNTNIHNQCRQQAALNWENLLLAALGNTLVEPGVVEFDEILGVVISVRREEDILSVWTRRSDDENAQQAVKQAMVKVLGLDEDSKIEYKVHSDSIKTGAEKQALYEQTHAHHGHHNNNHRHYPRRDDQSDQSASVPSAPSAPSEEN